MLNFWVKKPKNRDFDPVVPISGRVNIKILNCYILKPPQKNFWRVVWGVHGWPLWLPSYYDFEGEMRSESILMIFGNLLRFNSLKTDESHYSPGAREVIRAPPPRILQKFFFGGLNIKIQNFYVNTIDTDNNCIAEGLRRPQRLWFKT